MLQIAGVRTLILSLVLASVARGAEVGRRPNVIILMPDQMRGEAMSVAGNDQVITPNLDRLARDGVYLPNTIANNPVCCPARATIMTGRYPHGHGMIVNDLRLREERVTLSEMLRGEGYATGFVGKWHLDGGDRLPGYVPPGPRRQGFDFWAANQCDHRHFDGWYFQTDGEKVEIDRFEPEVWMDEALGFIRDNRDRPFFLWWACGPPHNPYKAPDRFAAMYDPAKLKLRPNWREGARWGSREDIAQYYGMVTAIDEQVGRLTALLDELDLAGDTIILFTSDHGDMLGSHGLPFKCKPWEESIVVPGVVKYPRRIPAGRRVEALFSHVDFVPTLLTLCGVRHPSGLHGRDLSTVLTARGEAAGAQAADDDDAVFLQIYEPREQTGVPGSWRGVRTKRYTFARFENRPWVLYDTMRDPYQLRNLVDDPAYSDVRGRLDHLIEAEMARTGDDWSRDLSEPLPLHHGAARYEPNTSESESD